MTQTDPIDTTEPSDAPEPGESAEAAQQAPTGLVAFAEAIEGAKGDLAGTLERLAQSLYERDRRELLDEMLARERENPGAFLSGALAGFIIGRGGVDLRRLEDDPSSDIPADEHKADTVTAPMEDVEQGAGGPDHLEPEMPEDEKP